MNSPINSGNTCIKIDGNESLEPKIKFYNGIHEIKSFFYSQKILLYTLVEDYQKYIIDSDKNNLRSKFILDACLNIFIFMRNSQTFIENGDIIYTLKKIFYIFLNQLEIIKSIDEN